jgi:CIC family chloride channel protein
MVLEVSGNYSIILPVILANTIAYLISRALQPVPIFETFSLQDGLDLPSLEEQREEIPLHIEDALQPLSIPVIQGREPISAASAAAAELKAPALLVQIHDGTWYAMTADELTGAAAAIAPETPIEQALKADRLPTLFPDLPLDNALPYFPRWPLLPVVNRASREKLEGIITLNAVLKRYQSG